MAKATTDSPAGKLTDLDIVRANFRFLREDEEVADSYEERLSAAYYAKLHREYGLIDLAENTEGEIGVRWRTASEVRQGVGQVTCGNLRCQQRTGAAAAAAGVGESIALVSFEVPFAYAEGGKQSAALVKVRLCPRCSYLLNAPFLAERGPGSGPGSGPAREREQGQPGERRWRRRRDDDSDAEEHRSRGSKAVSKRPRRREEARAEVGGRRRGQARAESPIVLDGASEGEETEELRGQGRERGGRRRRVKREAKSEMESEMESDSERGVEVVEPGEARAGD